MYAHAVAGQTFHGAVNRGAADRVGGLVCNINMYAPQ